MANLGHPSKFQRVSRLAFVTAATSLTGSQPNFAPYLAVSWAGTLCVHFRGSCPLTEFCPVQNSLYVQVFHCHILATLVHGTPAVGISKTVRMVQGMEVRNFHRRRHRYSAGRPSRWALAHILVLLFFLAYSQPLQIACLPYFHTCLLYTSPSPRDRTRSRMPSSA